MPLKSSSSTSFSRRSIFAAAAGLALSATGSNSARAQFTAALPDAAALIDQVTPVPAPDLKFTDAAGRRMSLADYRGNGLVVNIWATWCGPCVAELPSFAAISRTLARSKILVLPISVDLEGSKAVKPFYASHGITDLPILLDPDGSAMDVLNTNGIPVTIIVNPEGQLVGRLDGGADWNSADTLALLRRLAGPRTDMNDVQPA